MLYEFFDWTSDHSKTVCELRRKSRREKRTMIVRVNHVKENHKVLSVDIDNLDGLLNVQQHMVEHLTYKFKTLNGRVQANLRLESRVEIYEVRSIIFAIETFWFDEWYSNP